MKQYVYVFFQILDDFKINIIKKLGNVIEF